MGSPADAYLVICSSTLNLDSPLLRTWDDQSDSDLEQEEDTHDPEKRAHERPLTSSPYGAQEDHAQTTTSSCYAASSSSVRHPIDDDDAQHFVDIEDDLPSSVSSLS
jgi:hypothetical protein